MQNEIPEDKLKETEELSYEFAEKLKNLIVEINDKRSEGTSIRAILGSSYI